MASTGLIKGVKNGIRNKIKEAVQKLPKKTVQVGYSKAKANDLNELYPMIAVMSGEGEVKKSLRP